MDNETAGSMLNEYRELKAGRECLKAKMETGRRKLEEAAKRLGDSPNTAVGKPPMGPIRSQWASTPRRRNATSGWNRTPGFGREWKS